MQKVSVNKLVYDVLRKHNAVNSGEGKKYRIVDVITYLNEAYEIWFENKVFAAETSTKLRNDLRPFEIKQKCVDCEKIEVLGKVDCTRCRVKFPDNFYSLLNQEAKVCGKGCCKGMNKDIIIRILQSDDIPEVRRNRNTAASFKWEQLIGDEAGDYLYVYHEDKMTVKTVCIDYYRKFEYVEAPNLVECEDFLYKDYDNNIISEKINCEVATTYAAREISDVAVWLMHRDSGEVTKTDSQLKKILNVGKLYRT